MMILRSMRKAPTLISFLLSGAIFIALYSCSPQACFEETEAYLKASFYDNLTKEQLTPDSITLYGVGHDTSLIYKKAAAVKPALFPLDAASNHCTFVLKINGISDSITFYYTNYPHLISKECGYTFFHHLDTVIHSVNTIDYIYMNSKSISTSNEENIRIFY